MVGKGENNNSSIIINGFTGSQQGNRYISYNVHSIITPPRKAGGSTTKRVSISAQGVGTTITRSSPPIMTGAATPSSSPTIKTPRLSPSKQSLAASLGGCSPGYAGAKFSDPPSPNALPRPPPHWTESTMPNKASRCSEISNQLKLLLNVQA